MNIDIEDHIKIALHSCFSANIAEGNKIIHHEILGELWEAVGVDRFTQHNKKYLCIVDYHSKFQS